MLLFPPTGCTTACVSIRSVFCKENAVSDSHSAVSLITAMWLMQPWKGKVAPPTQNVLHTCHSEVFHIIGWFLTSNRVTKLCIPRTLSKSRSLLISKHPQVSQLTKHKLDFKFIYIYSYNHETNPVVHMHTKHEK